MLIHRLGAHCSDLVHLVPASVVNCGTIEKISLCRGSAVVIIIAVISVLFLAVHIVIACMILVCCWDYNSAVFIVLFGAIR